MSSLPLVGVKLKHPTVPGILPENSLGFEQESLQGSVGIFGVGNFFLTLVGVSYAR